MLLFGSYKCVFPKCLFLGLKTICLVLGWCRNKWIKLKNHACYGVAHRSPKKTVSLKLLYQYLEVSSSHNLNPGPIWTYWRNNLMTLNLAAHSVFVFVFVCIRWHFFLHITNHLVIKIVKTGGEIAFLYHQPSRVFLFVTFEAIVIFCLKYYYTDIS